MIDKKTLSVRLNQCAAKNMGHALFALFLMAIVEGLAVSVFAAPSLMMISQDKISNTQIAAVCILMYAAVIVLFIFQFGFAVLLLRMERNQYVTIGYIFYGFRNIRVSAPIAFFFSTIIAAIAAVCRVGLYFLKSPVDYYIDKKYVSLLENSIIAVIFIVLAFIIFIRFLFVYQARVDNAGKGLGDALKESARLMNHHVFDVVAFILRAGGWYLIIAIIVFAVNSYIPDDTQNPSIGLSALSLVLDFIYFVNGYTAIVRMYLSVPLIYDWLKNPVQPSD